MKGIRSMTRKTDKERQAIWFAIWQRVYSADVPPDRLTDADLYGIARLLGVDFDEPEPVAIQDELRAILALLDGLTEQWGDEAVFRRARDRLRKVIGEGTE
jgi:hypothetical protein